MDGLTVSNALALYDRSNLTLCSIGSHSALDVAAGARACGLRNLIVTALGRERTYARHFRRRGEPERGCVDQVLELKAFADILDAREAQEFGLVNRVVPRDELDAFVSEWATRLAAGPPLALSMTKTMLNNSMGLSMDQALEEESRSQAVNFGTADTMEAIAAFGEKREPRFEGR